MPKRIKESKRKSRRVADPLSATNVTAPSPVVGGSGSGVRNGIGTPLELARQTARTPPVSTTMFFDATSNRQVTPAADSRVVDTPEDINGPIDREKASQMFVAACQKSGRLGCSEILKYDLRQYVRYQLFSKLKFIMNEKQMNYSRDKGSFCMMICSALGFGGDDDVAVGWWEEYKDKVLVALNNKRADVTAAMKRTFLSKLTSACVASVVGVKLTQFCCSLWW